MKIFKENWFVLCWMVLLTFFCAYKLFYTVDVNIHMKVNVSGVEGVTVEKVEIQS